MRNVTGIFDSKYKADRAVNKLKSDGFTDNDISLIMSDKTRDAFFGNISDETSQVAKSGAAGVVIGGALGALLAGLTAVGSIVLTGGSVLVAGPIVAVLSGAGAGGIVGGLSGALISAGFATDEAYKFEDEVNASKAIVVVHVNDDMREAKARAAMSSYGANTKLA